MKTLLLSLLMLSTSWCVAAQNEVVVPAGQSLELNYTDYPVSSVTIKNQSEDEVVVTVRTQSGNEQIRGFGLGPFGKADVLVEKENKLVLKNQSAWPITLKIKVSEGKPAAPQDNRDYIGFTLRNNSAKSIPLIIPGVMNPNLSPFSNSGVTLEVGQKILFKENGKRHVLLVVDRTIKDGEKVEVSALMKERRKELGLK